MKHLGDITQIKGNEAPVVDCVIGGSPCQDLSVAGLRKGLAGERSGLYMEQIRIIKEMREQDVLRGKSDVDVRPRYMVWENVPGAFSSNQGKDFAAVIEEAIKVADPEAPNVPVPEKGWPTSGCIMGDNWSVAWRVLDAQFWGVPQRRRRIALVADFGGQSAPEILFIRKGVSRDIDESEQERKATSRNAENRIGTDDRDGVPYTLKILSGCEGGGKGALIQENKSATLSTLQDQTLFQPIGFLRQLGGVEAQEDCSPTLLAAMGESGNNKPCVAYTFEPGIAQREGGHIYEGVSGTLRANAGDNQMSVAHPICIEGNGSRPSHKGDGYCESDTMYTLNTVDRHAVVYGIGSYHSNAMKSDNPHSGIYEAETSRTLDALNCGYPGCNQGGMAVVEPVTYSIENHPADSRVDIDDSGKVQTLTSRMGTGGGNVPMVMEPVTYQKVTGPLMANSHPGSYTGQDAFSDMLVAGVDCRNATEYEEQTGALPPWKWALKRLCACYERDATMASLFDGIGGFPYIWEQINGKGSCLWASEIEEFPIAVTKLRFGGNNNENHVR